LELLFYEYFKYFKKKLFDQIQTKYIYFKGIFNLNLKMAPRDKNQEKARTQPPRDRVIQNTKLGI
jgi:hypothetical protein